MEYSTLFYPSEFAIGAGSIEKLGDFATEKEFARGLIVTDKNIGGSGIFRKVAEVLQRAGVAYSLFDEVISNPDCKTADAAAEAYRREHCDFLVAVGGGSAIDTAKAAALAIANGGSVAHYIGINRGVKPGAPVVAVATTAGTGSEVTRAFVLTDHEAHTKAVSIDDHCLVTLAISDPLFMTALPKKITAATALDALTHAMEAYCAVNHNPFTDGLALQAIKLIDASLLTVLAEPKNLDARTDLCWAASLAGYAFSNSGLGLMHSIGFSIENFCTVPHGEAVGMVMPYVLDFHGGMIPRRIEEIGAVCGLKDAKETVEHFQTLVAKAEIPTLPQIGFRAAEITALAEMALADPTLGTDIANPTSAELTALLEHIFCAEKL